MIILRGSARERERQNEWIFYYAGGGGGVGGDESSRFIALIKPILGFAHSNYAPGYVSMNR